MRHDESWRQAAEAWSEMERKEANKHLRWQYGQQAQTCADRAVAFERYYSQPWWKRILMMNYP